jgi:hypothetical protein
MSQAKQFIPRIITASTKEEAVVILQDLLNVLSLSSDYTTLNKLKQSMDEFSSELAQLESFYREMAFPRSYSDIHEIRLELTFLYRRVSDELSFDINRNKIFWEEVKTVKRAQAMLELADNEDFQNKIKAKSASALRDVYGASKEMVNYVNMAALAYGLYQRLTTLLNSIKSFMDAISSEERSLAVIENSKIN